MLKELLLRTDDASQGFLFYSLQTIHLHGAQCIHCLVLLQAFHQFFVFILSLLGEMAAGHPCAERWSFAEWGCKLKTHSLLSKMTCAATENYYLYGLYLQSQILGLTQMNHPISICSLWTLDLITFSSEMLASTSEWIFLTFHKELYMIILPYRTLASGGKWTLVTYTLSNSG